MGNVRVSLLCFSLSLTALSGSVSAADLTLARWSAQDPLIQELNSDSGCHLRRYDEGERMTFGRELTRPDCDMLSLHNSRQTVQRLNQLASLAPPFEAGELKAEADRVEAITGSVAELAQLHAEILVRGIVRFEGGEARVAHIGHPFDSSADLTPWLSAYVYSAQKLAKRWSEATRSPLVSCVEPACDPRVYRVAEAVTLKPPLDWAFLRDGDQVVAPSAYALSYFSTRYGSEDDVRKALGLRLQDQWMWSAEQFVNVLRPDDGALVFQQVISGMRVSLGDWNSRTEYPYVVPLFLTFQEVQGVLAQLAGLPQRDLTAQVREIHLEPYQTDMISFAHTGAGLRLNLKVLRPPPELGTIEQVRERLYGQITAAFADASKIN